MTLKMEGIYLNPHKVCYFYYHHDSFEFRGEIALT